MSAALALDTRDRATHSTEVVPSAPDVRPQLCLVPTGPDVVATRRPVRVTRRGRLVRSGLAAAVTLAVVWTVLSAVTAGAATSHLVTVSRGQTLSQIAGQQLPGLPLRDGVAALQLANGLNTSDIHAGQVLTVPDAG
jgi:negative regulator of sigma E activity